MLHNFIISNIIIFLFCNYVSLSNALKSNKLLRIILKVHNINKLFINKNSNKTTSLYKTGDDIERFYDERGLIDYPLLTT
jgi:hypothetical protein